MIKIVGNGHNKRVYRQIREIDARIKNGINLAFKDIGTDHKDQLIHDLNDKGSKSGRLYRVRVRGKDILHRASGPLQTPATLTGKYERGIDTKASGANQLKFGIDESVPYAADLEEGDQKTAKRPGLRNTIVKKERNTRTYFEKRTQAKLEKL